ncbi:MAG: zinc-ribbon domain-containing protein [Sphingomonas bacterium]
MAFCSECGSTLPDGARFCPKCGTETRGTEAPAGFAATPQPGRHPALAAAPSSVPGRKGFILPIAIVVAVALIGLLLWSQRDGVRPIAGNASERAETSSGATAGAEGGDVSDGPGEPAKEVDEEPAEPTNDTTIATAASLDSAFHSDPQGARDRYAGPVTVSGVIATMVSPAVSPAPTPALSLEGRTRFNFVLANFPSDDRSQLASLTKGDRVTVSCSGVNLVAGTTILQDCALE